MHRWSELFIPTLREAPADAEVASHKFLVRAGYVRQLAAGIYSYLFMGQRSFNRIMNIVRQEMDTIGQEFFLPAIHPRELWEESGRWAVMGQNMFRLKDRKGAELALGMTHEEVMTDIARKELRSYKQLPQIWYQIQTKFRDEYRPRFGLLRGRRVKDLGAILRAFVRSLPIELGGIVHEEIDVEKLLERDARRIVGNFDGFRVSGHAGADDLVVRRSGVAAGVSRDRRRHAA